MTLKQLQITSIKKDYKLVWQVRIKIWSKELNFTSSADIDYTYDNLIWDLYILLEVERSFHGHITFAFAAFFMLRTRNEGISLVPKKIFDIRWDPTTILLICEWPSEATCLQNLTAEKRSQFMTNLSRTPLQCVRNPKGYLLCIAAVRHYELTREHSYIFTFKYGQ